MFYDLASPIRENLGALLSEAPVKGSDANKIVTIGQFLSKTEHDPWYELDENLAAFAVSVLQDVIIKGKFAAPLLEIIIRLNKPMKEIPERLKPKPIPPSLPDPLQAVTQNDTKPKKIKPVQPAPQRLRVPASSRMT